MCSPIVGLFVLRRTRPDALRPYRAIGYPVLACALYRDGSMDLCCTLAIQTPVHVARLDSRAAWGTGVLVWKRWDGKRRFEQKARAGQEINGANGELFLTKSLDTILAESEETGEHTLKRSLGALNLVTLGIGAIIGTGIFVLTGLVASENPGPAWCSRSSSRPSAACLPDSATRSSRR